MKISGVYGIFNSYDGKVLVGSTIDLHKRWIHHRCTANTNQHANPHFQNAWLRDGSDSFEFRILELCDLSSLKPREDYWMSFYRSVEPDRGYNMVSACHPKWTEEMRKRSSELRKGRKLSLEHRRHIAASKRGILNPFYGKTHTPENRKIMSDASRAQINKPKTEESKHKQSEAMKAMYARKRLQITG